MPAGDPDSEEDTQEFPVFTGPYPRPTPAGVPAQPRTLEPPIRQAAPEPAAEQQRASTYQTSALAAMAGIVLVLFGVILALAGGAGVAMPDLIDEAVRVARDMDVDLKGRTVRTLLTSGAWILLVVGVVHILSAVGVFAHRQPGRMVGLVLALPGTLLGAYAVAQSLALSQAGAVVGAAPVVAAIVASGYGIVLFGLVAGGNHFRTADTWTQDRWGGRPAR